MTDWPGRRKVPFELRAWVRERAGGLCEYCHASEAWQFVEFTIDHLVPVIDGGETVADNLALACFACNRRKGRRRTGVDPETSAEHRLYNPRSDRWGDHFVWSADGAVVLGMTAIGRVTIEALDVNRERLRQIRAADVTLGRHPPPRDRRLR